MVLRRLRSGRAMIFRGELDRDAVRIVKIDAARGAADIVHSGGAQFGFCDGSVQFLTQSIDIKLYRDLSTVMGHELGHIHELVSATDRFR